MQSEAKAKALEQFTDYFVNNYPGPDTIIFNPYWHAPKIFAAAYSAITAAFSDKQAGEVKIKPLEWSRRNSDGTIHIATALPGEYWAWELAGYGYWSWGSLSGREVPGGLDAAKSAAQHDYATRIRSALVDVPAVGPVAKQWCAYEDGQQHTSWYPDGYGGRTGWEALAKRNPAKYRVVTRDLFTSPPHREGEDSAEVIEEGAKILAKWISYAWDGLSERDISDEYPDWSRNGIGSLGMQGGKPALRKVAAAILALAATRSASATEANGCDE